MEHQVLITFDYKTNKYRLVYTDHFFLELFMYTTNEINSQDIWLPVNSYDNFYGIVSVFQQCLNQINKFLEAK